MSSRIPDHVALKESEIERLLARDREPYCYCGAKTKEECDANLAKEVAFLEGTPTTQEKKP